MISTKKFLCLVFVLFCASAAIAVRFLPTMYVTSKVQRPTALEAKMYEANICNETLYHDMLAKVQVNLPHGWNPSTGSLAKIEACQTQTCQGIHCTNYPHGEFNGYHHCQFRYKLGFGNIYVRVTAGTNPGIDLIVAIDFVTPESFIRPPPVRRSEDLRYLRYQDWPVPEPRNVLRNIEISPLMQIVKTIHKEAVVTNEKKYFNLQLCPERGTAKRCSVEFFTIALDGKSAMSTFVCLPNELPCTAGSSAHSDTRGIPINTITLDTSTDQLTKFVVLVLGFGDGGQINTFQLGAIIKTLE